MAEIRIYGASDDLVEVEGDAPGCDEYNWYGEGKSAFIELSTGDVLSIGYNIRGVWEIKHHVKVKRGPLARKHKPYPTIVIVAAPSGDDPDPNTDMATITGKVEWVCFWAHWPPTDDDLEAKVNERIERISSIEDEGTELYRNLFVALFGREAPPTRP